MLGFFLSFLFFFSFVFDFIVTLSRIHANKIKDPRVFFFSTKKKSIEKSWNGFVGIHRITNRDNPSLIYPITLSQSLHFSEYRRKKERKKERSYSLRESLSLSLSSNESSALSYLSAILWIHAWMAKRVAWNIFNGKTFHLLLRQREPHLWDRRRISIRYYWFRARNTEDSVSSSSYFHIQHPSLPTRL